MYSNLQPYVIDRKPPMGAVLNPHLQINQGLAGYWPMWSGSGNKVFDLSGNGQDGTFGVSAPSWSPGKFGSALTFASGNNIVIADKINPTTAFSYIVWFKTTAGTILTLLSWNATNALIDGIWLAIDPDRIRIYCYLGNVGADTFDPAIAALNDNVWHQFAIVFNGATTYYYIDGVEVGTDVSIGSITYAGTNSYFGIADGGVNPLIGELVLPMMYDRDLVASEIALLYREPFCGFRWTSIIERASYVAAGAGSPILQMNHFNGGMAA